MGFVAVWGRAWIRVGCLGFLMVVDMGVVSVCVFGSCSVVWWSRNCVLTFFSMPELAPLLF